MSGLDLVAPMLLDGRRNLLVVGGMGLNKVEGTLRGGSGGAAHVLLGGFTLEVDVLDVIKVRLEEGIPGTGDSSSLHALLHLGDVSVEPLETLIVVGLDVDGNATIVLGGNAAVVGKIVHDLVELPVATTPCITPESAALIERVAPTLFVNVGTVVVIIVGTGNSGVHPMGHLFEELRLAALQPGVLEGGLVAILATVTFSVAFKVTEEKLAVSFGAAGAACCHGFPLQRLNSVTTFSLTSLGDQPIITGNRRDESDSDASETETHD